MSVTPVAGASRLWMSLAGTLAREPDPLSMTSRYTHGLPQAMTGVAGRIGQALWGDT